MRHLRARETLLARPPPPLDPLLRVHGLKLEARLWPPPFVISAILLSKLEKFLRWLHQAI